MAIINFGGVKEEVVTRKEFTMARSRQTLKKETLAVIGYGVQGPAQALNLRDNGFNVIIGQRTKDRAVRYRGSRSPRHHRPVAGFRRRPARDLAGSEGQPSAWSCPLFFTRLFDRLQQTDRGRSAEKCGRHSRGA